jgi:hypothetical protein
VGRKKLKSEPIDSYTYEVTQFGAIEGRRMLVQLGKILVPTLGSALQGLDLGALFREGAPKIADLDVANVDFSAIAQTLASSADPNVLETLMDKLADGTEVWGPGFGADGAPLSRHFDDHFAGRYVAMLRWLAFALRSNYGDFFGDKGRVAELVATLRAPAPAPGSTSPSTSTGKSGG